MNFPHTGTVQRSTQVGSKYIYGDAGSISCFLQPIDAESAQLYGITWAKGSTLYIPIAADLKEGDRIVIDSITYGVRGMKKHNYGNLKHGKAVLERV